MTQFMPLEAFAPNASAMSFDALNSKIMSYFSDSFPHFEQYTKVNLLRIRCPEEALINDLIYSYQYQSLAKSKSDIHQEMVYYFDWKKRGALFAEMAEILYHTDRIAKTIAGDPDWDGLF